MWSLLANFPDKLIEHLFSDEEYKLMAKFIKKLRKKEYARDVHAYTSIFNFLITLKSEYNASPKDVIVISFNTRKQIFSVGYQDVKLKLGVNYDCIEKQVESPIDAFVLRMFLTENNDFLTPDSEEIPSFQIGQEVETILDNYSRTYHQGRIYQIEKHHKENRFMYFIEKDGRKLKKRYFKDNLRALQ